MQRKAAVFLILAVCQMAVASAEPYDSSAPLVRSASPVPGEYLVVMKKGGSDRGASIRADVSALNAATISDSRGAVDYLLVKGTEAQMRLLSRNPNVVAIEENGWYGIQPSPRPTLPDPSPSTPASLWYLDQIDGTNDNYYSYCSDGTDVVVYVVDGGIKPSPEFGSRLKKPAAYKTAMQNLNAGGPGAPVAWPGAECYDGDAGLNFASYGHGTAVASIVGGTNFGVASDVTLVDIRILRCDGLNTTGAVVGALNWIYNDTTYSGKQRIVNMSFANIGDRYASVDPSYYGFSSVNEAVRALAVDKNMIPVAAAGNDDSNSFYYSPVSADYCIGAGASTAAKTEWSHSNYGSRVDFYAPGQHVEALGLNQGLHSLAANCYSTDYPNDGCTSGTSFAAPIISGIVARFLEGQSPYSGTWLDVVQFLTNQSSVQIQSQSPRPLVQMVDCF